MADTGRMIRSCRDPYQTPASEISIQCIPASASNRLAEEQGRKLRASQQQTDVFRAGTEFRP